MSTPSDTPTNGADPGSTSVDTAAGVAGESQGTRAARERQAWRESLERRRWIWAWIIGLMIIAGLGLIAFLLFIQIVDPLYDGVSPAPSPTRNNPIYIGLAVAAGSVLFFLFCYGLNLHEAVSDRLSLGQATEELRREEGEVASAGTDFGSLWAVTQKRIDLYHQIATVQSKTSFVNGQIAAYTGFLVIIVVAVIAGFTQNATGAIAAGVIGVAGAGLSGYIGATFMKAQAAASAQLREYFLQPVEFARVLAAERLLDKLEVKDRGPVVADIIKTMTSSRERSISAKQAE